MAQDAPVSTTWKPSDQGPERKHYEPTCQGPDVLQAAGPYWCELATRVTAVMEGTT
ncbi:MAG: hypothetical protein GXP34_03070 [Actinobacteria bacterium]|nr:hypothetical protein [Actinomycetota bacterium]